MIHTAINYRDNSQITTVNIFSFVEGAATLCIYLVSSEAEIKKVKMYIQNANWDFALKNYNTFSWNNQYSMW